VHQEGLRGSDSAIDACFQIRLIQGRPLPPRRASMTNPATYKGKPVLLFPPTLTSVK
jgi:hypothetical protein